jgi:hypothetical protein
MVRARAAAAFGIALLAALVGMQCGGGKPTAPTPNPNPSIEPPPGTVPPPTPTPTPSVPRTFVGAGDIGWCGKPGADQTARLVESINGEVFTAGDNAYLEGSFKNFMDCYQPTWGRFIDRTHPVPGNHEYDSDSSARGYYSYFGVRASLMSPQGYYSYDVGDWHIIALNSALPNGIGFGPAQLSWLEGELRTNRAKCTAAIWHHPLFSSGPNGPNAYARQAWRILYDNDADLIINGHDHLYERFSPQDPDGRLDRVRGIRQFTVGTGGADLYEFTRSISPNSEVRISQYGVIKFTLESTKYSWQFIPVGGNSDPGGTENCH